MHAQKNKNTIENKIDFTPDEPIKAVFWDVDGTMVNSEPIHKESLEEVMRQYGIEMTQADFDQLVGRPFKDNIPALEKIYGIDIDYEQALKIKFDYFDSQVDRIQIVCSGLHSILKNIKDKNIYQAAISNGMRHTVGSSIRFIGEDFFDLWASVEDFTAGKPDPAPYLFAAEKAGVDPKHCLVVEDSVAGLQAGLSAGMTVIACPYFIKHYQKDKDIYNQAQIVVDDLNHLDWNRILGV